MGRKLTAARLVLPALAIASVAFLLLPSFDRSEDRPIDAAWSAIGGCGAGGGGGAAGAGKWVGRGATGGLYDIQVLQNRTVGEDFTYDQTGLDLSTKLFQIYTVDLSGSWKSNEFEIQPYATSSDFTGTKTEVVGGFGDMGLSVARNFGDLGQHSATVSFGLPTGRYDIKRMFSNAEAFDPWMPPQTQPGTGHYTLGLTGETTMDRDWGLYLFGANYTAAFARSVPCGSSSDDATRYAQCQESAPPALTWRFWELKHNQQYGYHGAPGTGATLGDAASAYAYVAYKEEAATQSLGATLSIPMAPSYWWEKGPSGPFSTERRNNDYTLKLSYGVELNLNPRNYPVFFSLGVPFILNPIADGSLPGSPSSWILTAGIKGTFL